MKYQLVMEVEYVRKEKIIVEMDDKENTIHPRYSPPGSEWVFRKMQYHMHTNKDLVKHEEPRLIRWHWNPLTCQYPNCTKETGGRSYCQNHNDIP